MKTEVQYQDSYELPAIDRMYMSDQWVQAQRDELG